MYSENERTGFNEMYHKIIKDEKSEMKDVIDAFLEILKCMLESLGPEPQSAKYFLTTIN